MVLPSLHKYNKANRTIKEIKYSHNIDELREAYYSFQNITRKRHKDPSMNDELNTLRSQMKLYWNYERATKAKERNAPAVSDDDLYQKHESNSLQSIPIPQDYERHAAQVPWFITQQMYEHPAAQYPQFINQQTYEHPTPQEYLFPTNDKTTLICYRCTDSINTSSSEEFCWSTENSSENISSLPDDNVTYQNECDSVSISSSEKGIRIILFKL